jgi:uncharacterized protein (TIGR03032 family)
MARLKVQPENALTPSMPAKSSPDFAHWLRDHDVSLAFSTYRANRLMFLGRNAQDEIKLHERLFDRPMGLFAVDADPAHGGGHSLWMAGRSQLWRLDNLLSPGQLHAGADRLYVPAASFTTGEVNAHEIVITSDAQGGAQPLFVNTAFSCLARVQPGCSFAPAWQPPFISELTPNDRCHLNGLALVDGVPTWATACGVSNAPAGWRDQRAGGGVVLHIPTQQTAATGLTMPHSPRWHGDRLWLLNSGTGELGWIDNQRFVPLCFVPGFARGLAFVDGYAVVGLSKLRSPQFGGLALEHKLSDMGLPGGCCGLRVIHLASGAVVHSLDLPEPIDELFDVVALPGARQPRALGLQGEDIHCLVKLPGNDSLTTIRPRAPSGHPHQAKPPPVFGLPPVNAVAPAVHYQRVYQLTPATLMPYASLTFPRLALGSPRLAQVSGELLAVSAAEHGAMVGLAVAERHADGSASLLSLMVQPHLCRQGIATRMLAHLQRFLAEQGVRELAVSYPASPVLMTTFEPLLKRLHWAPPKVDSLNPAGLVRATVELGTPGHEQELKTVLE